MDMKKQGDDGMAMSVRLLKHFHNVVEAAILPNSKP